VRNFQILTVSAVKISQQCLQITSASVPQTPYLGLDPTGASVPKPHWSIAPLPLMTIPLSGTGTKV